MRFVRDPEIAGTETRALVRVRRTAFVPKDLASEEDAGTVHADLGGNLARTTGSGGEAT